MFNQTIQHPYVVIYKASDKAFIVGHTIAASKDEAIDKLVPEHYFDQLQRKDYRARRNIIHRVYTTA